MRRVFSLLMVFALSACGNPGNISDEDYAKYKELGRPKILYACHTSVPHIDPVLIDKCEQKHSTDPRGRLSCLADLNNNTRDEVAIGYAAGVGVAVTYNKLLGDIQSECSGRLEILDSKS